MNNFLIPKDIQELSQHRAANFRKLVSSPRPQKIEVGQIWSTYAVLKIDADQIFQTNEPRLIVILEVDELVSAQSDVVSSAPISLELNMSTKNDLVVTGESSPLYYDFLIEVWNETPVLLAHLKQFLGKLGKAALSALNALYKAQLRDEEVSESLSEWVGTEVFSKTDPRVEFQKAENEAVKYLANAATSVLGMAESNKVANNATNFQFSPVAATSATRVAAFHPSTNVINLQLRRAKLSQFIVRSDVAAASSVGESERNILIQKDPMDNKFISELLYSQRSPFSVYLKVHDLSPELLGKKGMITIVTSSGKTLQSSSTELQVGGRIDVGQDPNFQPSNNHQLTLEVML